MKSIRDEDPMEDLDDPDDPVLEGSDHDLYDIIEELDEGKHVLFLVILHL